MSLLVLYRPHGHLKSNGTTHITEDLVSKILICLPVKPILRFRCVCKPWCSLIDSTKFIKEHLQRNTECNPDHGIIFRDYPQGESFYLAELDSSYDSTAIELADPLKSYLSGADLVGSCNGLVCLCKKLTDMTWWNPVILLWNPSTGKARELPSTNASLPFGPYGSLFLGFGYDHLNDDYKVVRTCDSQICGIAMTVYSLKRNSWTEAETIDGTIENDTNLTEPFGRFSNGSLYWLATKNDGGFDPLATNLSHFIFAFDLGVKRHKQLSFPAGVNKTDENHMGLTVFNRCLWLFDLIIGSRTDIWLMNDNGAEISWSKLISVEQPGICGSINVVPVAFSKTGKDLLLVAEDDTFMWYNRAKNEVKYVTINGFPDSFDLLVYTESLVELSYLDGKDSEEKKRKKQPEDTKKRKASKEETEKVKNLIFFFLCQ